MQKRLVWDLPVRVFHWSLVILVAAAWISVETGFMTIHSWIGYGVLGLLLFRLIWGLVGSRHARFSDFVRTPGHAWGYLKHLLRRDAPPYDGHNPAGGLMVVLLLLVLLIQAGTGLFANDDLLFEGPFAPLVGGHWSAWLTDVHKANFNIIIALVVVHVAAVALHEVFGERLTLAMLHGYKESDQPQTRMRPVWLAVVLLALAAGTVWWLLSLAPPPVTGF